MISLEKAAIINGVMTRLFDNGNSEFLTDNAIEHTWNEASPAEYSYVSAVLCLGPVEFPKNIY